MKRFFVFIVFIVTSLICFADDIAISSRGCEVLIQSIKPHKCTSGTYYGKDSSYDFTFVAINESFINNVERERTIKYRGQTFSYSLRTSSAWGNRYLIKIERPNNPTLMGWFLSWEAFIEPLDSETIELTVVEGLNAIDKVKYKLPEQGTIITLKLEKSSAYYQDVNSSSPLRGIKSFAGIISINNKAINVKIRLDFTNGSGSSTYSSTPLPLVIDNIQESKSYSTFTLIERNPARTSIPDNYLGGNKTAVFYCTYHSDGAITGNGENYKGQPFTISLTQK